jgi:uncharacterized lipoprotein
MRINTPFVITVLALVALLLSACGGRRANVCEPGPRFAEGGSVPPITVPEGLTPPDQSQSLVIPPAPDRVVELNQAGRACLERPPNFFETPAGEAPEG